MNKFYLRAFLILVLTANAAGAQEISAPEPQTGTLSGTVIDVSDTTVPGATIVLKGPGDSALRTVTTNENGFFVLNNLTPGIPYEVTASAEGYSTWTSPATTLQPGQYFEITGIRLQLGEVVTTVTAVDSPEEIAVEQVRLEEKQRVFGIIPNFYVAYDPNTAPLTPKLKFKLALRASFDPVTVSGLVLNASIYQAASFPGYIQGAKGYGQRLGSTFAGGYTNIMVGDALLPSLLHQDPRYFYQGTGTTRSRLLHALSSPIIARGDNGRREINFSNLGGDLASGAIANAYYPAADRGSGLVLRSALIGLAGRATNGVVQEFILRRFTSNSKSEN